MSTAHAIFLAENQVFSRIAGGFTPAKFEYAIENVS